MAVGLAPGMLLPFAVSWRLNLRDSDTTILALSVATTLIGIAAGAVEATSIASAGGSIRTNGFVVPSTFRRLNAKALTWSGVATVIGGAMLAILYGASRDDRLHFWLLVLMACVASLIASLAAVQSGAIIAHGRPAVAVASQGARALIPLLGLLAGIASPGTLVVLFVAGEILRYLILRTSEWRIDVRAARSVVAGESRDSDEGGLPWQIGFNATAQIAPSVGRTIMAPFAGAVTAMELSEKVLGMATQVAYNFGLLPHLGGWSTSSPGVAARLFRRDSRRVAAVALGMALSGVAVILLGLQFELFPSQWRKGLQWAMIAMIAAPSTAITAGTTRYIAIVGAQRSLGLIGVIATVFNVVVGIALTAVFGAVGFVLASVATRYLGLGLQLHAIRRAERSLLEAIDV